MREAYKGEKRMLSFGLLVLRLIFGGLLAGHGAQKLFGWFGGHGLQGTAGWLKSMNMHPSKPWAVLAGLSEFGGGVLTALGFLNPLGPLATMGAMGMAAVKVHGGKPIWVTSGGAELPLINLGIATALAVTGPGKYSVDCTMGIKLPRRLVLIPGMVLTAGAIAYGVAASNRPQQAAQEQPAEQPHAEQPHAEEQPAAVRVPDLPAGQKLDRREELVAQNPDRVSGAELQAGQEASHAV
jgi:putative oxidoreductase